MLPISDFDYPLTDDRIAKYPLPERDHSKLLVYQQGVISEDRFFNIGNYLPSDSLLVYNNTRVIQARLIFHKATGARIEVFCLEPLMPHDYQLNLSSTEPIEWKCMIGNLKKWKNEELVMPVYLAGKEHHLYAKLLSTTGNTSVIGFRWDAPDTSFAEILNAAGELPIPPYLNRKSEESDKTTYQTVYSKILGSVAAPTAGLHFTPQVLGDLKQRGIQTTELTLHVGAGTFQPVKTADANEHTMHTEIIAVPRQAIEQVRDNAGHIVAVGTTSVRTLESLYFIGEQLSLNPDETNVHDVTQFYPYNKEFDMPADVALDHILRYLDRTGQDTLHAATQIMIRPGYRFRIVNHIITNFHQPKSTLLLLVSAFIGDDWHKVYDYALNHNFRFLSYGDSSLLSR